jgi:hypothetical protein
MGTVPEAFSFAPASSIYQGYGYHTTGLQFRSCPLYISGLWVLYHMPSVSLLPPVYTRVMGTLPQAFSFAPASSKYQGYGCRMTGLQFLSCIPIYTRYGYRTTGVQFHICTQYIPGLWVPYHRRSVLLLHPVYTRADYGYHTTGLQFRSCSQYIPGLWVPYHRPSVSLLHPVYARVMGTVPQAFSFAPAPSNYQNYGYCMTGLQVWSCTQFIPGMGTV